MQVQINPTEITVTEMAHKDGQLVLDLDTRQTYPGMVIKRDASDPGPEWPDFIREERIAADAYRRARSRIGAVISAVLSYEDVQETEATVTVNDLMARKAVTLIDMELQGIGGPRGLGGDASARMSWASVLGKGRKQATDGPAWTAAIEAARQILGATPCNADEATLFVAASVIPEDCEWALCWALTQALKAATPTDAHAWMEVAKCALVEGNDALRARWSRRVGPNL